MNKILVDEEPILNLVGISLKEHAVEIMSKNLCLEEYININIAKIQNKKSYKYK